MAPSMGSMTINLELLLLSFNKKVHGAGDRDEYHGIIYLDFSKAFDKVTYQKL